MPMGRLFTLLVVLPWEQQAQRPVSRNKGASWYDFPPLALSINTESPSVNNTASTLAAQHAYTKSCPPCLLLVLPFSGQCASILAQWDPYPEDQTETPTHTISPDQRVLQVFNYSGSSIRSHLTSRPEHS